VVDLEIDHPRPQDLLVVLHQPGGASAVLWNHQASPPSQIVAPSGIEGDNMVNGEWVLEITDTVTGESGTLKSWKMWISSNWD
jgi:subtilisin-like proprotein convertase family protein